ncbi:transcriptional regulator [Rothia mucilaginosa DY-18]|uniref:Transcriptional regulator n=1 Tax=Rothia mucilaginosa (strain DY-18) TaxID=680646 RepID=D2NQX6_ROTMD|nr:transcriptional regulator [Rothia mucilaginosa DY-18]
MSRSLGVLACHLVTRVLVHSAVVQASAQTAEDSAEEAQRQNQQNRQQAVREVAPHQLLQGQGRDTVLEQLRREEGRQGPDDEHHNLPEPYGNALLRTGESCHASRRVTAHQVGEEDEHTQRHRDRHSVRCAAEQTGDHRGVVDGLALTGQGQPRLDSPQATVHEGDGNQPAEQTGQQVHAGVAALLHGQCGCGGEDGFRASGITCGGGDDEVVIIRRISLRGTGCRMGVAGCGHLVACSGGRCGSGGATAAYVVRAGGCRLVEPAEVVISGFAEVSAGFCALRSGAGGEDRLGCGSRLGEGAGRILRGLCGGLRRRARLARLFVGAACRVQLLIGQDHGGVVGGECRLPQVTFGGGGRRGSRTLLRGVVLCVH